MTHPSGGISRRDILRHGATLGLAAACAPRALLAAAADSPHVALTELAHAQVQFGDSPAQRQASENHAFLLGLDEDALLFPFRKRGGQPAPGSDLDGWYGAEAFAAGATFGQWMSGLSRHAAITGDAASREKVGRLVRGYAATIDAQGRFYQHYRFPAYTYDKLAGGLVDAATYAGDRDALKALQGSTDAALPYLPPRAMPRNEHAQPGEDFTEHAWDESYTMPENQFLAFDATRDPRHLALARRFLYDDFFLALARGDNALPGKHAYSHVNALSSAARAGIALRQPVYLEAAKQGFAMVDAQSFATGGWGPDEHFVVPGSGALGASLEREHKSFETPCGAYAHMKLTRYLLRTTGDARYGDSMERVLYNTVFGALPIQRDGRAFYYSDYTADANKGFHPDHWPCCSGTLPLIAADYRISAFFADAQGLTVNLYLPGRVRWQQAGAPVALVVDTAYPQAAAIALRVEAAKVQKYTLRLRIPAWAQGARLAVNGKAVATPVPGQFAAITREWRDGDRIELELPLRQRLEAVDAQHPDRVALVAGPLVLMRVLDDSAGVALRRADLGAAQQVASDRWSLQAGGQTVTLRPFIAIDRERYRTYQDLVST